MISFITDYQFRTVRKTWKLPRLSRHAKALDFPANMLSGRDFQISAA